MIAWLYDTLYEQILGLTIGYGIATRILAESI